MLFASLAAPALAGAQAPSPGGAQAPGQPSISAVVCADGRASECARGSRLRIVGENLNGVERVRFLGGPGRADDRVARPQGADPSEVSVVVPRSTRTGPVEVRGWSGSARVASIRITAPIATTDQTDAQTPAEDGVFPIRGKHDYGTFINRFGGGRGHQGQDVFAACGTSLVAAWSGEVIKATFQSRAGNYVVIQHADGRSTAYMHMRLPRPTCGPGIGCRPAMSSARSAKPVAPRGAICTSSCGLLRAGIAEVTRSTRWPRCAVLTCAPPSAPERASGADRRGPGNRPPGDRRTHIRSLDARNVHAIAQSLRGRLESHPREPSSDNANHDRSCLRSVGSEGDDGHLPPPAALARAHRVSRRLRACHRQLRACALGVHRRP
ncbi:MAG: M23 family metallopeptidase [Actinobacteria bacterium]|nr:M23 family metallopeptidase [Actinomycetota bacterium]